MRYLFLDRCKILKDGVIREMEITELFAGGEIMCFRVLDESIKMEDIIKKGYEPIYKYDFIKKNLRNSKGFVDIKELEKYFEEVADGCSVAFVKTVGAERKPYSLIDLINNKIVEI